MSESDNTSLQRCGLTSERIDVPKEYEKVFTYFYYALNDSDEPVYQKLLPTYQTILVFSFGGKITFSADADRIIEVEKVVILSTVKKLLEYALFPGAEMLVVNFQADSFYRFFGRGLDSGKEFLIQPGDLTGDDCFTDLWRRLKTLASIDEKTSAILDFCRPYLKARPLAAEQILTHKDAGDYLSSVKIVAARNKQSVRTVQLNHKKFFGYTEKEKNRYERFMKAVRMIDRATESGAEVDWFEIIVECGYYDQSQMIHDFNFYLNLAPTHYLKQQREICRAKR